MTLLTTSAASGDGFAPTQAADYFFDHLTANSVGLASGFRRVRTDRDQLDVPKVTDDPASAWTSEGAEITASQPSTDTITATPRKLAGLVFVSNEMIADSNPDAQDMVAETLSRDVALRLDRGFYEGTGTPPQIQGLRGASGIQTYSMGTDGAALTNLDPFAEALGMLAEANAAGSAIVMHPRNWRTLIQIKETSGSTMPLLLAERGGPTESAQGSIYGVPVLLTSQLSTSETKGTSSNANSIYVYEAAQVVAVMRKQATVETDRSAAFSSDRTAVRVTLRADMVLPNPAAVVRITGVIPG